MLCKAQESVFTTDGGKLKIVPADIDWLLMSCNTKLNITLVKLSLLYDVVPELGEDEVPGLEDVLPSLHWFAWVGQTLSPNIHGAPVLGQLANLNILIVDHVAPALVRLHDLLEENKVLILDAVHIAR